MLDGLVGGAVLSQADGVVGHHKDGARLAQCRHADGRPHVVCMRTHAGTCQHSRPYSLHLGQYYRGSSHVACILVKTTLLNLEHMKTPEETSDALKFPCRKAAGEACG